LGSDIAPFRREGFDTGGVKNSKLFEELATSSWNLVAGVEIPEKGHRSELIWLFTDSSLFDIRFPIVSHLIRLDACGQRRRWYLKPPKPIYAY